MEWRRGSPSVDHTTPIRHVSEGHHHAGRSIGVTELEASSRGGCVSFSLVTGRNSRPVRRDGSNGLGLGDGISDDIQ